MHGPLPISIGFELETAWFTVMKLSTTGEAFNPRDLYRVDLTGLRPRQEAQAEAASTVLLYPDTFTADRQAIPRAKEAYAGAVAIDLGGGYAIRTKKLESIFRHAEFVVTFPSVVDLPDAESILPWTKHQLDRAILDIRSILSSETWKQTKRPVSHDQFFYKGDWVVNPAVGIGLLGRSPEAWPRFMDAPNFVIQCTYGIRLVMAFPVWSVLQRAYAEALCHRRVPSQSRTVRDLVAEAWEESQGWIAGISADDTVRNFLFLLSYTFMTHDRRKSAVFTVRHSMASLWMVALDPAQRRQILGILQSAPLKDRFRAYAETVIRKKPRQKSQEHQALVDVGLLPYDTTYRRFFFEYRALTTLLRASGGFDSRHLSLHRILSTTPRQFISSCGMPTASFSHP